MSTRRIVRAVFRGTGLDRGKRKREEKLLGLDDRRTGVGISVGAKARVCRGTWASDGSNVIRRRSV